ncbi:MAG: two-component system sensor histidine kinase NtrB [Candidatus Hodarchaeales archaeon]|jgi:PAS domain S-box-containing protein
MNSNINKRDYWKTLIILVISAQILSLVPSLIFYLLNISAGTTVEPASLITGLPMFIIPNFIWLYYVFSHILQAFNLPDKQKMFKQINKYRKHFQIFYLPFSISIVPLATAINRRLLIPSEDLEILAEVIIGNVAIPSIFFVPSYIFLEYVLDRIICPKVSEHLGSGEIHLFTTLSVLQKYLIISIFMVFGTFSFILNALLPSLSSLDGLQIIAMSIFVSVPVISFVSYYFTTEPKSKEINQHLNDVVIGNIDSTIELPITSQDSLGNLSQLYNATVNRFSNAGKALRESEERYRTLFEQSPIGVYRTTYSGKFLAANPVLVEMLGYSSFEKLSQKDTEQLGIELDYPRNLFLEKIQKEGEIKGFEGEVTRPDGSSIVIRENAKAIRDSSGTILYFEGTVEDITENKKMEEELFRKERLSILGTMSAGIAHEVRNPMGAIKNSAYFLKLKLKEMDDQKVHKHIQIIDTEINRANKIITDLLNFSRVKLPSKENTHISNVINEILEELSSINGKIEIKVKIPPDLPKVFVDSHQIEQVIHNLIVNAIESMPDGGKLEIVSKIVGKEIVVNIKDTGTGISEKNKEKIFQPLFTTKGNKGIGLGLALSKQLMILNDGSITFASEVNKGTTFTIAIPVEMEENFSKDRAN